MKNPSHKFPDSFITPKEDFHCLEALLESCSGFFSRYRSLLSFNLGVSYKFYLLVHDGEDRSCRTSKMAMLSRLSPIRYPSITINFW